MSKVVLGIDYGTKRIGVAIAYGPLAEPLAIVENLDWEWVVGRFQQLCQREKVELLVVGLSENQMAEQTRDFAQKLSQALNLPVEYVDETLSSYEMHFKLRNAKNKKKQAPIDHLVAAQLLQDWLDEKAW